LPRRRIEAWASAPAAHPPRLRVRPAGAAVSRDRLHPDGQALAGIERRDVQRPLGLLHPRPAAVAAPHPEPVLREAGPRPPVTGSQRPRAGRGRRARSWCDDAGACGINSRRVDLAAAAAASFLSLARPAAAPRRRRPARSGGARRRAARGRPAGSRPPRSMGAFLGVDCHAHARVQRRSPPRRSTCSEHAVLRVRRPPGWTEAEGLAQATPSLTESLRDGLPA
jgi:hypothetical protein